MFYPNKDTDDNLKQNKHSEEHQTILSEELTNQNASANTPTMPLNQINDYHQVSFNNNLYNENLQFSNDFFDDAANDPDIFSFDYYPQFQEQDQNQEFPINLEFTNDYEIDDSSLITNQSNPQNQNSFIQSSFESTQNRSFYLSPKQIETEEQESNFPEDSEIGVGGNRNMTSVTEFSNFQNPDSPLDFGLIQDQNPNLSLFPDSTQSSYQYDLDQPEENSQTNEHQSSPCSRSRSQKRKVELDAKASLFKDGFYKIFNKKRKKFPKNLVKKIHNRICEPLNLIKMPRKFERSIDLYFQAFSQHSNQILCFLQQHKEELMEEFPELRELK